MTWALPGKPVAHNYSYFVCILDYFRVKCPIVLGYLAFQEGWLGGTFSQDHSWSRVQLAHRNLLYVLIGQMLGGPEADFCSMGVLTVTATSKQGKNLLERKHRDQSGRRAL